MNNWILKNDCFEIHLNFIHGDADAFTTEIVKIKDEEDFNKKIEIVKYLEDAIYKHFEGSTEDVVKYIQKKTLFLDDDFSFLFDVIKCDCTSDEFMARLTSVNAVKVENGKIYEMFIK